VVFASNTRAKAAPARSVSLSRSKKEERETKKEKRRRPRKTIHQNNNWFYMCVKKERFRLSHTK
jgi:hypothetical protein